MPYEVTFTDDQQREIVQRYRDGATISGLAHEYGIAQTSMRCFLRKCGVYLSRKQANEFKVEPGQWVKKFAQRARELLWHVDDGVDPDHPTYNRWKARIAELTSGPYEYNKNQATIQASREFDCLGPLLREYCISIRIPISEFHARMRHMNKITAPPENLPPAGEITSEGKKQTYREDLAWALEAAGAFRRTGAKPASCPNDGAYYLFVQACDSPKEFLQRLGQAEARGGDNADQQEARKAGRRQVAEIDAMLAGLDDSFEDAT